VKSARLVVIAATTTRAAASGSAEITFRFWLDQSGVIANAELLGSGGSEGRRRAIASKIQGLQIGGVPPTGHSAPTSPLRCRGDAHWHPALAGDLAHQFVTLSGLRAIRQSAFVRGLAFVFIVAAW
jgi:hypothetical protein